LSRLRAALALAGFVGLTLPLMPVQQMFVWFWPRMARRLPMHYHRMVLRILGVRVQTKGETLKQGPMIFVANHVSWLDIVILSSIAPLSFIAKNDVNRWPFFGSLARLQHTVFVDRERRITTGSSRDEIRERLAAGDLLVLFPEGTSGDGASVLSFKSAFFAAAEDSSIQVQPISVVYTGHRNLPMTRRLRPHYAWYGDMELPSHLWSALAQGPVEITLTCHAPLSLAQFGNRKALARHTEETIRAGLVQTLHGPREIG
jgi:lyso-ornithine lipid O-acyltransferase